MNAPAAAKITPIRSELHPMDTPRLKRRRWPWIAAGLVVIAGLTYAGYRYVYEPSRTYVLSAGDVTVSTVTSGPFVEYVAVRGQVAPGVTVSIAPEISGRVEEVMVEAGEVVEEGDVLLKISNPGFELEMLSREAQAIEQINSQRSMQVSTAAMIDEIDRSLIAAEFRIGQLEDKIARVEPLVASGSRPSSSLADLRQELAYQTRLVDLLKRQSEGAETSSREIGESLQRTAMLLSEISERRTAQLESLVIKAPVAGTISGVDLVPGEQVAEGQSIGNVDATDTFKVVFMADEFFLSRVSVGQRVLGTIGGTDYGMIVTETSARVENGQFHVEAAFDHVQPERLLRGQAILGRVIVGDIQSEALHLPTGAFLESSSGRWAYRVGSDGIAVKEPIEIGRRTNDRVEILSGLSVGDRVITSGYGLYSHLDTVRIEEES